MLGLKLLTDDTWAKKAEGQLGELLTDHAYCEQKAASHALSIIIGWPEHIELVTALIQIAREELEHFERVLNEIKKRNLVLGFERKDNYVNTLMQCVKKGLKREFVLIERLLFAAMIEARSCERFKRLSEQLQDRELAAFYKELMISEAHHYTRFIEFAHTYAPPSMDVTKRWNEWIAFESSIITQYGKSEQIHG
jgi:tRNA-(ms[2]io[6]A)-hydroxylase